MPVSKPQRPAAWSEITGKPSTIAGYGITNAVSNDMAGAAVGNFYYLQNNRASSISNGQTYPAADFLTASGGIPTGTTFRVIDGGINAGAFGNLQRVS